MKKIFRSFRHLIIAGGFCVTIFLNLSSGQALDEKGFSGFFDGVPEEKPLNLPTKNAPPKILDFFLKPESKSEDKKIQET